MPFGNPLEPFLEPEFRRSGSYVPTRFQPLRPTVLDTIQTTPFPTFPVKLDLPILPAGFYDPRIQTGPVPLPTIVETLDVQRQSLAPVQIEQFGPIDVGAQAFSEPNAPIISRHQGLQGLGINTRVDPSLLYLFGGAALLILLLNLRKR